MTLHLLRLVWNRKRQNLLLTLEIFLSFVVLFTVVYFAVLNYYYWRQPLGFVADRVWTIDLKYPDSGPSSRKSVSTPDTASRLHAGERIQRIHEALSVLPNIETIAASWPSTAYESGGWSSSLGDPTRAHSWMNFASDDYQAGGDERFTRNASSWIGAQCGVKHGIRDLVGDFVWMAFSNRLGRKQVTGFAQNISFTCT